MKLVTPKQMREMDRMTIEEIGIPGMVLMERAALGAVDALVEYYEPEAPRRIGILCGGGNNGGDGLAMGRMLSERGFEVAIGLMSAPSRYSGDANANHNICRHLDLQIHDLSEATGTELPDTLRLLGDCDVWVDALLGTGLDRDVEGNYAVAIDFLNDRDAVFSVDVPSGLNSATGQIMGRAVHADATATFGLEKLGQSLYPGRDLCGDLYVIDIGIPATVVESVGAEATLLTADAIRLPDRDPTFHKGAAGRICLIGGNVGKSGAILMATRGALLAGGGLLTVGTTEESVPHVAPAVNEAMSAAVLGDDVEDGHLNNLEELLEGMDTVAIGPGLGQTAGARAVFDRVLDDFHGNIVVDADGLNLLAEDVDFSRVEGDPGHPNVILTPHPGEMARLRDCEVADVLGAPVEHARELAEETACIVVLKMASTVIAHPDGRLAVNPTGNPGMATGGMGDALTGIIAAQICEARDDFDCICAAVFAHGMAGDLAAERTGERGLSVSALLDALPSVWHVLESR